MDVSACRLNPRDNGPSTNKGHLVWRWVCCSVRCFQLARLRTAHPSADLSNWWMLSIHPCGSLASVHDLHALRQLRPLSARQCYSAHVHGHQILAAGPCVVGIMAWPPRSPYLNTIEHIWDTVQRSVSVRDLPPANITELWNGLQEALFFSLLMLFRL